LPTETTFRDFRKTKGSKEPGGDVRPLQDWRNAPFTVKEPQPPGQEPGLVPDIRATSRRRAGCTQCVGGQKLDGPGAAGLAEVKKEIEAPAPVVEAAVSIAPAASVVEGRARLRFRLRSKCISTKARFQKPGSGESGSGSAAPRNAGHGGRSGGEYCLAAEEPQPVDRARAEARYG